MPAISFDDWNSLDDAQRRTIRHHISIGAGHPINNAARPTYVSGHTVAGALLQSLHTRLAVGNINAARLFNELQQVHRAALREPHPSAATRPQPAVSSDAFTTPNDQQLQMVVSLATAIQSAYQQQMRDGTSPDVAKQDLQASLDKALKGTATQSTPDPHDDGFDASLRRMVTALVESYLAPITDSDLRRLRLQHSLNRDLAVLENGLLSYDHASSPFLTPDAIADVETRIGAIRDDLQDLVQPETLPLTRQLAAADAARLIAETVSFPSGPATTGHNHYFVQMATQQEAAVIEATLRALAGHAVLPNSHTLALEFAAISHDMPLNLPEGTIAFYVSPQFTNLSALQAMIDGTDRPILLLGDNSALTTMGDVRLTLSNITYAEGHFSLPTRERVISLPSSGYIAPAIIGSTHHSAVTSSFVFCDPTEAAFRFDPHAALFSAVAATSHRLKCIVDNHNEDHHPAPVHAAAVSTLQATMPERLNTLRALRSKRSLNAAVIEGARFYNNDAAVIATLKQHWGNRPILISSDPKNRVANTVRAWARSQGHALIDAKAVRQTERLRHPTNRSAADIIRINRTVLEYENGSPPPNSIISVTPVAHSIAQANFILRDVLVDNAQYIQVFSDFRNDYHSANLINLAAACGRLSSVMDPSGELVPISEALHRTASYVVSDHTGARFDPTLPLTTPAGHLTLSHLGIAPPAIARLATQFPTLGTVVAAANPGHPDAGHLATMVPYNIRQQLGSTDRVSGAYEFASQQLSAAHDFGAQLLTPGDSQYPGAFTADAGAHTLYMAGQVPDRPLLAICGHDAPVEARFQFDRRLLAAVIADATRRGFGIAVEGHTGVPMEVAAIVESTPNAALTVVLPHGFDQLRSRELADKLAALITAGKAALITHEPFEQSDARNRQRSQDILAKAAAATLLVQAPAGDNSLNLVKLSIDQGKPTAAFGPDASNPADHHMRFRGGEYVSNVNLIAKPRGTMTITMEARADASAPSVVAVFNDVSDPKTKTVGGTWSTERESSSRDNVSSGKVTRSLSWDRPLANLCNATSIATFLDDVDHATRGPHRHVAGVAKTPMSTASNYTATLARLEQDLVAAAAAFSTSNRGTPDRSARNLPQTDRLQLTQSPQLS